MYRCPNNHRIAEPVYSTLDLDRADPLCPCCYESTEQYDDEPEIHTMTGQQLDDFVTTVIKRTVQMCIDIISQRIREFVAVYDASNGQPNVPY